MSVLNFNPHEVTKKLIDQLPDERARDVIISRYGLGDTPEGMTLEAIGQRYGITRERVRQIEGQTLDKIRQSEEMGGHNSVIDELHNLIHSLGVIVPEHHLLPHVSEDKSVQNHVFLLLDLGDPFMRHKEDKHFTHRWHVDQVVADAVHDALKRLHDELGEDDLVSESDILKRFVFHLDDVQTEHKENNNVLLRWLGLSKKIDKNPLGEWGLAESPNIKLKGVRDYAYLVLREHGSPMHFREVTKKIRELFDKDAHIATTHNELIKDDRFVLVGRGLYALSEWGYMRGVVRDVIEQILEKHGPLTRDEVVEKVLKERYVKENTVVVNLQNNDIFQKTEDGKYTLA